MCPTFNETKATQAAGWVLERSGRRLEVMKLLRLLYLADREAVLQWGRSITTDCCVLMPHGPVLSQMAALIARGDDPRTAPSLWHTAISRPREDAVELQSDLEFHQLSDGERELLDGIVRRHGARSAWELLDLARQLPEWRDPCGSAIPLGVQDILAAHGRPTAPAPAADADPEGVYLNFSW